MRKKVLYVIIAVLALILVAGLVFIFTMPKPQMDAQQDTSAAMDATDNTVVTDVPSAPSDVPGTDPTEGKKPTQAQIIGTIIPEPTEETVPEDTRLIPDVPDVSVPDAGRTLHVPVMSEWSQPELVHSAESTQSECVA